MKKNYVSYVVFSIFVLVGIGLLVGSAVYAKYFYSFMSKAEEITGEVARIEEYYDSHHDLQHRVFVSYRYNGVDYEDVAINFYSSSMYEGKEITLYCDPDHPYNIKAKSSGTVVIVVLTVMGLIFLLIGMVTLIRGIRKKLQKRKRLTEGKMLRGVVDRIEYNTSVTANGMHPFVIFCSYRDEYKGITYRFKSENIWTDPSLVFQPGSAIEIYVEENDYSKYYVNAQQVIEQKIVDFT